MGGGTKKDKILGRKEMQFYKNIKILYGVHSAGWYRADQEVLHVSLTHYFIHMKSASGEDQV